MKKIFHAAETIRGGVATVIRQNVLAQAKALGPDKVLTLVPQDQAEDLEDAKPFVAFYFARTGRNLRSFFSFAQNFMRILRREKPDIIHLHSSFAGLIGRITYILVKLTTPSYRPRIIYCPHAFGFLMDGAHWKKKAYALIERMLLPVTDAVICVSRYERDAAIAFGLPGKKLHVIYNGVPVPQAPPERPDPETKGVTQLLFVGRLDVQKGFDLLVQAMEQLENEPFHLTVVGGAMYSSEKPPQRPNISYAGWIPASKVGEYITACDVLVMPSRWESFGLVAAEAATYERPALSSDSCSLPEIVLDGKTGRLFPVGDVATMVRILQNTSREDWRKMGKAARLHVTQEFSGEQMIRKTLELYQESTKTK